MESTLSVTPAPTRRVRGRADQRMRRFLRIPDDAPRTSILAANHALGGSIAISGARCLVTYVLIPLVAPVLGLSGTVGPVVGLVLSVVSTVAIVFATRRFFAAEHRWRWAYASVGGAIVVFLLVQSLVEVVAVIS